MIKRNGKGCPPREFNLPVLDHRSGANYKYRTLFPCLFLNWISRLSIFSKNSSKECNCLNGLAQPHVITKNASMVVSVKLI
uniref:Uncharacterized protein n=1 Tax=Rhizophora mucronata TaxID=61149 RepID=A0A2P2LS57_RHIMU